jgi:mono/diheme cytochrome c family protein
MQRSKRGSPWVRPSRLALVLGAGIGLVTAVASFADLPGGSATEAQVLRGRQLVIQSDCGGCHNRGNAAATHDPTDPKWLSGLAPGGPPFVELDKYKTNPRNLTPDNLTGLGRISARQIFNALRYGLKPGDTPDAVITSNVPGEGNFPAVPKYLAPPMPWPSFRHMSDAQLWDIVAYLKHGIKAVDNKVTDSEGPPDFWASEYTQGNQLGPHPLSAYPMASEAFTSDASATMEQVLQGRQLVIENNCGACHNRGNLGAAHNPSDPRWLSGNNPAGPHFPVPNFKTYARNLTPDNDTGLGKISTRQIFNALRYGLKPGDTPDVIITSNVPGEGNFPAVPKYLAPPMPWPSFRHMRDEQLMAIAAYLKYGIKAVSNKVPDSERPPNFWAATATSDAAGPFPLPSYPAGNEEFRP